MAYRFFVNVTVEVTAPDLHRIPLMFAYKKVFLLKQEDFADPYIIVSLLFVPKLSIY